ncbi:MAG: RraA family protein [Armatimonadetes bacterium]|nr:RraA family protein [Armatimonadota bacterium]MDW8122952.1 RraA family protein [Armatimonadota bacterium]
MEPPVPFYDSRQSINQLPSLFDGLRVADVSDGMDAVGLRDVGLVDRAIRPLLQGVRVFGRALTVRYVPAGETVPSMTPSQYADYSAQWYRDRCPYPFLTVAKPGDILVVDMSSLEVGFWGSQIALSAKKAGIVAAVLDGGCRDTYEIRRQKTPVWARYVARTTVIGRLEFAGMNETIQCGGVRVSPGDIIVADDDGVIVVPAHAARDVALAARRELESDKNVRRRLYEDLNLPLDETVQ